MAVKHGLSAKNKVPICVQVADIMFLRNIEDLTWKDHVKEDNRKSISIMAIQKKIKKCKMRRYRPHTRMREEREAKTMCEARTTENKEIGRSIKTCNTEMT